jgi:hypothetical protein
LGAETARDGPFGADRVDAARIGLDLIGGNQWPMKCAIRELGAEIVRMWLSAIPRTPQ